MQNSVLIRSDIILVIFRYLLAKLPRFRNKKVLLRIALVLKSFWLSFKLQFYYFPGLQFDNAAKASKSCNSSRQNTVVEQCDSMYDFLLVVLNKQQPRIRRNSLVHWITENS